MSQDNSQSASPPDTILATQYFWRIGSRAVTGEQRLMLAVLADAINLVRSGTRSPLRRTTYFTEAMNWLLGPAVRCPLAFEDVCDALKLDAERLRSRIRSLLSGPCAAPKRLRIRETSRPPQLSINRKRRRPLH